VWIGAPLNISSKWRYYVLDSDVIGYAPFQATTKNTECPPEPAEVSAIVARIPPEATAYALDVAVLADGQTTLLTVRDAWGLDLLASGPNKPHPLEFLTFLWRRWSSQALQRRTEAANSEIPAASSSRE